MIKVIGAVSEIVPIPDLNDRVFYKQEKTFSEAEYQKSLDLKKEIQRGRLVVVSRVQEKFSEFEVPPESNIPANSKVKIDNSVEVSKIVDMVKSLETRLEGMSPGSSDLLWVDKLLQKIESLENRLSQITSTDNAELVEAIKRLENRFNETDSQLISKKLEELVSRGAILNQSQKESTKTTPEEVYVPNIRIEDGSSHIKLKTRTIEKSSSVEDAANALKRLRDNK